MDVELVALALSDIGWILLAFALGMLARFISLPPLVGFLAAGFILNQMGATSGEMLNKLADIGITLLLFMVGLKLDVRSLIRPQVWAVACFHVLGVLALYGVFIYMLTAMKLPLFDQLDWPLALLIALGMSFSSTVFVVKVLEERGGLQSYHGRLSIGILIVQDLIAVIFLAASSGKVPSVMALAMLVLIPLRPLMYRLLLKVGHGELLVLFGLVMALGGAELFEIVGVKGDLGALILGVLIAPHPKSAEMAKAMLGFKDVFLVSFFLSIGLSGQLSAEALSATLIFLPLILFKAALFFWLMTRFRLRARTALLSSLNLGNYSEFGLIVIAAGVSAGWLHGDWLVVMALALSLSLIASAILNRFDNRLYRRFHDFWVRFQLPMRLRDDRLPDLSSKRVAIFGMGRVGSGAYDRMAEQYGEVVVGFDINEEKIKLQRTKGREVYSGDPSDEDFWEKLEYKAHFELIMLSLPNLNATKAALEQIRIEGFKGIVATTAKYPDEIPVLQEAGADKVFNLYTEAGAGFADLVEFESCSD